MLLVRFAQGMPGKPRPVSGEGLEIVRPAVALDGQGRVIVAWSENRAGNFDLVCRSYDPKADSLSQPRPLTSHAAADTDVVLATAPDGAAGWPGRAGETGRPTSGWPLSPTRRGRSTSPGLPPTNGPLPLPWAETAASMSPTTPTPRATTMCCCAVDGPTARGRDPLRSSLAAFRGPAQPGCRQRGANLGGL